MEQLNYVHLRGHVGNVRLNRVGDRYVCNFGLATNSIRRNSEGNPIEETTWHNCTIWSSKKYPDLSMIVTGAPAEVEGSIKNSKYTGADNVERSSCDINVTNFFLLPSNERLTSPVL